MHISFPRRNASLVSATQIAMGLTAPDVGAALAPPKAPTDVGAVHEPPDLSGHWSAKILFILSRSECSKNAEDSAQCRGPFSAIMLPRAGQRLGAWASRRKKGGDML